MFLLMKIIALIKKHAPWLFRFIEMGNDAMVWLFYRRRIRSVLASPDYCEPRADAERRPIGPEALTELFEMLSRQDRGYIRHVFPHGLHRPELRRMLASVSYLTFGAFVEGKLAGFAYLKIMFPRKAMMGIVVAAEHRGKGLGKWMVECRLNAAKKLGFRCFAVVSNQNAASLRALRSVAVLRPVRKVDAEYVMYSVEKFPSEPARP